MANRHRDAVKERFWREVLKQHAASGMSGHSGSATTQRSRPPPPEMPQGSPADRTKHHPAVRGRETVFYAVIKLARRPLANRGQLDRVPFGIGSGARHACASCVGGCWFSCACSAAPESVLSVTGNGPSLRCRCCTFSRAPPLHRKRHELNQFCAQAGPRDPRAAAPS